MEPLTILAALGPLIVDLGKTLIGKIAGPDFKPVNIADWVTMQKTDIDRFTAINAAGGMNPSYPWVEAVIRLQRPAVAAIVLGVWSWSRMGGAPSPEIDNFAATVGFYLFGERSLFYAKQAAK